LAQGGKKGEKRERIAKTKIIKRKRGRTGRRPGQNSSWGSSEESSGYKGLFRPKQKKRGEREVNELPRTFLRGKSRSTKPPRADGSQKIRSPE